MDQQILVEVVAIGKREDLAVYQEALKRFRRPGPIGELFLRACVRPSWERPVALPPLA